MKAVIFRSILVAAAVAIAACGSTLQGTSPGALGSGPASAESGGAPVPATPCAPGIDRGVLPDWARAGFSDPEPSVPHVLGRSGAIAAILFGDPLSSPPSPEHTNKILWVAREQAVAASMLTIQAQRMDGAVPVGSPVEREVDGGPGPSIIDLPGAGCWRLTLAWADRTDSLDLEYVNPA